MRKLLQSADSAIRAGFAQVAEPALRLIRASLDTPPYGSAIKTSSISRSCIRYCFTEEVFPWKNFFLYHQGLMHLQLRSRKDRALSFSKGFTLVELLLFTGIMAIMAGAIVSFSMFGTNVGSTNEVRAEVEAAGANVITQQEYCSLCLLISLGGLLQ